MRSRFTQLCMLLGYVGFAGRQAHPAAAAGAAAIAPQDLVLQEAQLVTRQL